MSKWSERENGSYLGVEMTAFPCTNLYLLGPRGVIEAALKELSAAVERLVSQRRPSPCLWSDAVVSASEQSDKPNSVNARRTSSGCAERIHIV